MRETRILRPFGKKSSTTTQDAADSGKDFQLLTLPLSHEAQPTSPEPLPSDVVSAAAKATAGDEDFYLLALHLKAKAGAKKQANLGLLASGNVDVKRFATQLGAALEKLAPQIRLLPLPDLGAYIAEQEDMDGVLILREEHRRDPRLALLPDPIWGIVEEARPRWPLAAFGALAGAMLGAILWVMVQPEYEAEALLHLRPDDDAPLALLLSYAQEALTDDRLDALLMREGFYADLPTELRRRTLRENLEINASAEKIVVTATSPAAPMAAHLANALAHDIVENASTNQLQRAREELTFFRAYVPEAVEQAQSKLKRIEAKAAPHLAVIARARVPEGPRPDHGWLIPLLMAGIGTALGLFAQRPWRKPDALLRIAKRKGPG